MLKNTAFTLIELLIVVAIIAILAAIAVPNFLEAQTRSKVSRAQADMRSLATAIEAYSTDHTKYPSTRIILPPAPRAVSGQSTLYPSVTTAAVSPRFKKLTTPVAYITTIFRDPFVILGRIVNPEGTLTPGYDTFDYVCAQDFAPPDTRGGGITSGALWRLVSAGPDGCMAYGGGTTAQPLIWAQKGVDYNSTNGTVSWGDIVRVGGGPANFGLTPSINRVVKKYNF